MPNSDAPKKPLLRLERYAGRDDSIECAGNPVPGRVVVGEPRSRERQIGVEREPRLETRVNRPLNADPTTWPAGLRRSGIANEQQL